MGIIAWIVLGLGAGLLANMLIPGRRSQGLIVTCVIGIAGALLGGWLATKLFHVVTLHGFFNLSTWLTAIAGAAVLLLAYHLVTSPRRWSTNLAGVMRDYFRKHWYRFWQLRCCSRSNRSCSGSRGALPTNQQLYRDSQQGRGGNVASSPGDTEAGPR